MNSATELLPHAFIDSAWRPAAPAGDSTPAITRIVTWNVWFGAMAFRARKDALLAELARLRPDVVLLQEVTRKLLTAILAEPFFRAGYQVSDADGSTFGRYGVLLLSRIPIRRLVKLELPSDMGRCLLSAELASGLTVATSHLESTHLCAPARAAQLGIIQPYLAASSADVVFAGDMNFAPDAEEENAALDPSFVDVWPTLHGDDPGHTVDTDINFMRYVTNGKHSRKRIDRVFLRSSGFSARAATILGTTPIDAEQNFISDHFGLEVELGPR